METLSNQAAAPSAKCPAGNVIGVLDLDGVISTEQGYFQAARQMVLTILGAPEYLGLKSWAGSLGNTLDTAVHPDWAIQALKARAINSNWDSGYFSAALHLLTLLKNMQRADSKFMETLARDAIDEEWLHHLGFHLQQRQLTSTAEEYSATVSNFLDATRGISGLELVKQLHPFGEHALHVQLRPAFFAREDRLWWLCYELFQGWYIGSSWYQTNQSQLKKVPALLTSWPGLMATESPLLPLERLVPALRALRQQGALGIFTGRPSQELQPLRTWGILHYFDAARIVTYQHVMEAEREAAGASPQPPNLAKPHPYTLLRAVFPTLSWRDTLVTQRPACLPDNPLTIIVIGDSASDMRAAQAAQNLLRQWGMTARIHPIGVLSGGSSEPVLRKAGSEAVVEDLTRIPELMNRILPSQARA